MLVLDLQIVLCYRELDPDPSFACVDRLPNLDIVANLADSLIGSSCLVEHRIIAVVRKSLLIVLVHVETVAYQEGENLHLLDQRLTANCYETSSESHRLLILHRSEFWQFLSAQS